MKRTESQLLASDPARHIWVSASAGTGKTHVLTDRLLRLMLDGAAPDRILALTFTKAAAAEMQTRLTGRLSGWLVLDDAALDSELLALAMPATAAMRARARRLFGLALDVPGGLKVQTLHSFAQGLLAGFPLEAGLSPGFSALEERDALLLKRRALHEAIRDGGSDFRADLAELAVWKGEAGVSDIMDRMIAHWPGLSGFATLDAIDPAVRRLLGVPADAQPGDASRAALADPRLEPLCRDFAADMAAWGTKTGLAAADAMVEWLAVPAPDAERLLALRAMLLTKEGEPRSFSGRRARSPALAGAMDGLCAILLPALAAEAALAVALHAARAMRVGREVAGRYDRLKRAANAVDFDDMIRLAAELLGRPGMPGYVAWKLDNRFDHLLVDEAQDTNELQWRIIRQLVSEYFAGGARQRTLFVVGDLKQAIYGFQGTDPRIFAGERARIAPHAPAAILPVPLDRSFRSGPAVLDVVNAMLVGERWRDMGLAEAPGLHVPHRAADAGEVELWPLLRTDTDEEGEEDNAEEADRLMARRLAARIAGWLKPGGPERLWLPAQERYARPHDILVLLRKRSMLMGALVAALHKEGVSVAGVDRLLLNEPYAVLDLVALVRFATQPEDDLNLAAILVSPFLGWTHEEVRAIAQRRRGSLWGALGAAADARGTAARAWLNAVLNLADRGGPAAFLDTILSGPLDGRRLLLDRLGGEANDAIDELLQQAVRFELHNPPALAGFLAWIESEGLEVKRDAEAGGDHVRLMTVHGSKGLQASVVVLADTGHNRRGADAGHVPVQPDGAEGDVPVFHMGKNGLPDALQAVLEDQEVRAGEEDRRLLYVALTRAADHLYIGGAVSGRRMKDIIEGRNDNCWHSHMRAVLGEMADVERIAGPDGEVLRVRRGDWSATPVADTKITSDSAVHAVRAVNLSAAPAAGPDTRPLTPSALPEDPPSEPEARAAARRGTLLHRLFERLPAVSSARRGDIARNWLALQGEGPESAERITAEVLAVLESAELADLFAGDALVEAPIAGIVDGRPIAGTVDRLLVTAERVLIVDFKSGSRVPATASDVPGAYRRQMAAYARVLAQAFPGRRVEAGLLFTAAPKFLLLPDKLLQGAEPLA